MSHMTNHQRRPSLEDWDELEESIMKPDSRLSFQVHDRRNHKLKNKNNY